MKFIKQKLENVYLIEAEPYKDKRGMLRRQFCQKELKKKKLMQNIKQINISENISKHTLRGFHYQSHPHGEDKIISCVKGSIYDVIIDMRKSSRSYLKWQSFIISEKNRKSIFVPKGCANAYLSLSDNTWVLYFHSQFYKPGHEKGLRYNDPFFKIKWPSEPKIISKKDLNINLFSK